MEFLLAGIIIVLAIALFSGNKKQSSESPKGKSEQSTSKIEPDIDYTNAYKLKWLFSMNEKTAYFGIKEITDELGLHLMAKVRLLDLLEPQKGHNKYKTLFYKIQAKHVDFVVCSDNLVAKCIIEIDDNSHKREDRKQRDNFVDQILTSVGYKIIRTRGIEKEFIQKQLIEKLNIHRKENSQA